MSSFLKQFLSLLTSEHSKVISRYDEAFLLSTLQARIETVHCKTDSEYLAYIGENPHEVRLLITSLHISHSEFFRNSITFATLDRLILPSLITRKSNSGQTIRIWSAACARGEEPYSIAILFEEHNTHVNPKVKYRIFATDHDESVIDEAQKGEYGPASVGNLRHKDLTRWFTRHNGRYIVKPDLRNNIAFSLFDLLGNHNSPPASIYGDFDIIVCANLLFYYGDDARKKIVDRLTSSLAPGGYLITGEAEREIIKKFRFREIYPESAVFTAY